MRDHTHDPARSRPDARLDSDAPAPGRALRPDQTFVVQLRGPAAGEGSELMGRVEHVVSGEVLRFRSTAELVAFLSRPGSGAGAGSREAGE